MQRLKRYSLNRFSLTGEVGRLSIVIILTASFLTVLLSVGNAFGQSGLVEKNAPTLRVLLHDVPGVQFLGMMTAVHQQLYEAEGLPPVELCWQEVMEDSFEKLAFDKNDRFDFVTGWMAEGILARATGLPVIAIAQVREKSSACFLVRTDLNPTIKTLSDLKNQRIGVWFQQEGTPLAFLADNNIASKFIPQQSQSHMLFSEGAVDAVFSTTYSPTFFTKYLSYHSNVQVFYFKDRNINYPENAIFCTESFLRSHPQTCQKFVLATFKGWQHVMKEREQAVELLSQYCQKTGGLDDRFILAQQLDAWCSLFGKTDQVYDYGYCSRSSYEQLLKGLIAAKLLDTSSVPDYEHFFCPVLNEMELRRFLNAFEEEAGGKPANATYGGKKNE